MGDFVGRESRKRRRRCMCSEERKRERGRGEEKGELWIYKIIPRNGGNKSLVSWEAFLIRQRGSKRDKNVLPPFWIARNFAPGQPTYPSTRFVRVSLFLSISIYLSISFLSRPSSTTLCTHRQHSIIRPCQLQPLRLTTEEFDVLGNPYVPLALADSECVGSMRGARELIGEKEGPSQRSFARWWRRQWRNNLVRAFFVFHRALICFPVICCSVPLPFLGRVERRANICLSQSPGIIWNKHSRRVINPSDVFPTTRISHGREFATTRFRNVCTAAGFPWQSSFCTRD